MGDVAINLKHTMRSLRVRSGYTQEAAAALFKVSPPVLRTWEVDSSSMEYAEMELAEAIYNTPKDYIFFGPESALSELLKGQKGGEEDATA